MKYFDVLKAKAELEVEQTNVLINQKNVELAKHLYETGKKAK